MILNRRKGFSLMELLVVVALLPIVAIAIYSNFRSAVNIWKQATVGVDEEDLSILSAKVKHDFSNTFKCSTITFKGDEKSLSMAVFVKSDPALGGDRAIGQIRYAYDPDKKMILRTEKNVNELFKEKTGRSSLLLAGITQFHIRYFLLNMEYKKYEWREDWTDGKGALPLAVRFQFDYKGRQGTKTVSKTFVVPVGGA